MTIRGFAPLTLLSILTLPLLRADDIKPDGREFAEAHQWVAAKFEGRRIPRENDGFLLVHLKSGSLEKNSREGHPLQVSGKTFTTGVHAPSTGTIEVHLSSPARGFKAAVGVDSNDISYYSSLGRGSVIATVEVDGNDLFHSPVMHEGLPPTFINVDLKGTSSFTVRLTGTDKAGTWDQADLGDASVTLADGRQIALADLPIGPLRSDVTLDAPFTFAFGGVESAKLLPTWELHRNSRELDSLRTEHTLQYRDPATGLEIRCVGIAYRDFPTVEWTLYLKNTAASDTPIIENIQALDTRFETDGAGAFTLHHSKGTPVSPSDYQPFETSLAPGSTQRLGGKGGRPTNKDLSYMNLAVGGGGVIIVVGWPGQWAGQFVRDNQRGVHVQMGQEQTHFTLHPGEEVRSPLIVLQFWRGDWLRSQNIWRRWMIAHSMPRPGGKLPPAQMAGNTSREYVEMTEATDKDEMMFIDRYREENFGIDYFWMDAGWYPNNGSWVNTGTWEVDTQRFPRGLRAVSDHAHAQGVKIILWFEPERVTKGSWLYEHHPEWLLTAREDPGDQAYDKEWRLLNLGNPDALKWLTDHVDTLIREQGIDLYRQDFNMDPLNFWRGNDTPDRQGITEIRYITGYLAYWDELRRRHPNMLLDSCASGGRRNDVESLRRAVPLTRSDDLLEAAEPFSQQMQTYGIALWMPFFGTGVSGTDPYTFRSQMTPGIITAWDLRDRKLDYDKLRVLIRQWRTVAPNYYGDFYPLTDYSLDTDVWAAMQFHRAEAGEGFVEVFRRSASPYDSAHFRLRGLEEKEFYVVTNLDTSTHQSISGKELMEAGVSVQLKQKPDSALFTYKKQSGSSTKVSSLGTTQQRSVERDLPPKVIEAQSNRTEPSASGTRIRAQRKRLSHARGWALLH